MEETRGKVPVENYDELFCLTLKEQEAFEKDIDNFHKDVSLMMKVMCDAYPNDKELGEYIRRHYGSSKGE